MIHSGVGPISESDILLASASNAVVVGFNVKVESMAVPAAKREGVQVKLYSIIYELIDQMKEAMAGLLDPEHRETVIGHAEVKQVFQLSRGIVAGCLVTDGRIARSRTGARAATAPTGLRRRALDPAPFPGRREGSPCRSGMRHQAGRLQRISGGRHHRVLSTRAGRAEIVTLVIPSEVEAATQRTKSARPGFQSRGEPKADFTGSFDSASLRSG